MTSQEKEINAITLLSLDAKMQQNGTVLIEMPFMFVFSVECHDKKLVSAFTSFI